MSDHVSLTQISSNAKTGAIPVSTSTADWCPNACPFKRTACYADTGPLHIHWKAVTQGRRGVPWDAFLEQVRELHPHKVWRYGQAGDLPGDGERLDRDKVLQLAEANDRRPVIVFTHYDVLEDQANRDTVVAAREAGLPINLSANHLEHADRLAALGIAPVVAVLPIEAGGLKTPAGRPVVVCPATRLEGMTCKLCQLCAKPDRTSIVGFPAHGTRKKIADTIARSLPT